MLRRNFRKNKLVKKPKRVFKKKRGVKKSSVVQIVNRVLSRKAETKLKTVKLFLNANVNGGGVNNQATGFGLCVNNLLSSMALDQGVEQEQRIGNKISNCKLKIRGFARTLPIGATNPNVCPYELHMLLYKNKIDGVSNDIKSIKTLPGNNTGIIDGSVMNTCFPFNKDQYTILGQRTFRMNPVDLITAPSVGNVEARSTYYRRFQMNIPIKDVLLFRDGANLDPTNDYVGIGFYWINGDASDAVSAESRCDITADLQLSFKDL